MAAAGSPATLAQRLGRVEKIIDDVDIATDAATVLLIVTPPAPKPLVCTRSSGPEPARQAAAVVTG